MSTPTEDLVDSLQIKRWNKTHRHSLSPSWELYKTQNGSYAVLDKNAADWFAIVIGAEGVVTMIKHGIPFSDPEELATEIRGRVAASRFEFDT
jgi:hypothetical protein